MKTLMKQRFKLVVLSVLQILVVIAPIIALVIYKRNDYFTNPEKIFSLSFAGVVALCVITLQVMGKTPKNLHKLIKLALLTLFLWVMKPVLLDLCLLTTATFVGELLGFLCFSHVIKMQKLKISALEIKKTEESLQTMSETEIEWRGRV